MDVLHRTVLSGSMFAVFPARSISVHENELYTEVLGVFAYVHEEFLPCAEFLIGFVCSLLVCVLVDCAVGFSEWEELTQAAYLCVWTSSFLR
jgi:hypothetical protein